MLLQDCVLDIDLVMAAPFQRTQPEEEWVLARDSGAIPPALYSMYCRAGYLSFGSDPPFLCDPDHLLFSYFGLVLRSAMESLQDADGQLKSFIEAQNLTYDLGKKLRGEPWDKGANARAKRHFRDILIALQTSL